ncbi:MFS transporter [Streptomyces sp. NPDC014734]|uniref:MFS transporter n=1 Tax=Streptomyces sp. NPDC014734 TaxID=3364886 RepID=UPI0037026E63
MTAEPADRAVEIPDTDPHDRPSESTEAAVRPAYREPAYRRYLVGEVFSVLGDQIWFVALAWKATELTSPSTAGLILSISAIPRLILMLFGGMLADRYDARKLMVSSDLLRAAVMFAAAGIALWQEGIFLLVLVSLVFGIVDAVFLPAAGSVRPRLLQPQQLSSGAALRELGMRGAVTLGAPLGGLLMTAGGIPVACAANGITFLISMMAVRTLRPRPLKSAENGQESESYIASLRGGLRYMARHRVLRGLLVTTFLVNFAFVGPMNIGLALLARSQNWGAGGVGNMLAGFGIGAAMGAVVMVRSRRPYRAGLLIAAASVMEGVGLTGLALASDLWVAVVTATFIGLVSAPLGIAAAAVMQEDTADEFRGRVSSVNSLASLGITPLAIAVTGAAAEWFGTRVTLVASAQMAFIAGILCLALPDLRRR